MKGYRCIRTQPPGGDANPGTQMCRGVGQQRRKSLQRVERAVLLPFKLGYREITVAPARSGVLGRGSFSHPEPHAPARAEPVAGAVNSFSGILFSNTQVQLRRIREQ